MCGRYAIEHVWSEIRDRFRVTFEGEWKQRYNAAPGQDLPVILQEAPGEAVLCRWGFIPHWAKEKSIGYRMINARAETLADKPSYISAYKSRRCLVIASGFYEWKDKVPYYFASEDRSPMALAGLYDRWKDPAGGTVTSFTIITTAPNPLLSGYHDRMPAILREGDAWLGGDTPPGALQALLTPYQGTLRARRVSGEVSNPRNDYPGLLKGAETP